MIHNANNLSSKTYKPSYVYSQNILTSTQDVTQAPVSHLIVESNDGGIQSIIDEINNGLRVSSDDIPIIYSSYISPVYDVPQSLFSVSELLNPEDFGDTEPDVVTYNL
jgi:hypothetical protein